MASPALSNFCAKCGIPVANDDRFCRSCGAPTQSAPSPEIVAPQIQAQPEKKKDKYLAVRVILLIAAGVSAFTAPWLITAFLVLVWLITLALPQ